MGDLDDDRGASTGSAKINLLSDLHLEFESYHPADVKADIVVLAGDIGLKEKGVLWANDSFRCPVVYVPGNHEYYGGHLVHTLQKMRDVAAPHVHVLDCDEVIINNVRFLGATMWTDFASTGSRAKATMAALAGMSDFKTIRTERYRKITPHDLVLRAERARRWLETKLRKPFGGKTVIITHHAPTLRSIQGSPYAGNMLDAAYANAWDDLLGPPAALWLHGHTHVPTDHLVNGTRVVCNPRGYPSEEIEGFDPQVLLHA
ncbi:MAG: metallophosphoesterase [Pseudomonas profundi]|uniref:metallophosphoesterase n=1 Tax=Pseudomonas profundi TaxID=1981513 RepID=UPI0030018832